MHSDWEDVYAQEQQQHSAGEGQRQHSVGEEQRQHSEEQQENVGANEQQHTANAEEQQKAGAEDHMEEPEPWQFSNMYHHPGRTSNLPVSRGKSIVAEEEVNIGNHESDGDYAIPPAESDSSASDDDVLEYLMQEEEKKAPHPGMRTKKQAGPTPGRPTLVPRTASQPVGRGAQRGHTGQFQAHSRSKSSSNFKLAASV